MAAYVKKIPYLTLIGQFENPLKALPVLGNQPVDILFLDIQMPEITGISFLKTLKIKPQVILTTAYSEYAIESYELDVVDYLLKPITFERFLKAVEKASQRLQGVGEGEAIPIPSRESPFVFLKDGTKFIKVLWNDILYIEGLKDYVTVHTSSKKIVTFLRMKNLEDQLPKDKFIRVHHSYIIALHAIDAVFKSEVKIGEQLIPISETYRKNFREIIEKNNLA